MSINILNLINHNQSLKSSVKVKNDNLAPVSTDKRAEFKSIYNKNDIGKVAFGTEITSSNKPMSKAEFKEFYNKIHSINANLLLTATGKKPVSMEAVDTKDLPELIKFKKLVEKNNDYTVLIQKPSARLPKVVEFSLVNNEKLKQTIEENLDFFQLKMGKTPRVGEEQISKEEIFEKIISKESPLLVKKDHDVIGVCLGFSKENSLLFDLSFKIRDAISLVNKEKNPRIDNLLNTLNYYLRPDLSKGSKEEFAENNLPYPVSFDVAKKGLWQKTWQNDSINKQVHDEIKQGISFIDENLNTPEKIFDYFNNK